MIEDAPCSGSRVWFGDKNVDTIPFGYIPVEPVGQGAYGFVFSALKVGNREKEPIPVAIKKLNDAWDNETSKARLFRELLCMKEMNHPNVLKLVDVMYCNKAVYIVSELMETDLGSVVKSSQSLSVEQMLVIFYQLIDGVRYIHDCGIIHRDLKPRNILVSKNCDVKICDFGLARTVGPATVPLTDYVCTRWYRAPEILVPAYTYTNKIDIFSLGCIIAEVVSKKPLLPGKDSIRQYDLILRRFGKLSDQEIALIPDSRVRKYLHKLNVSATINGDMEVYIGEIPTSLCPGITALIRSLVRFDPRERATAQIVIQSDIFREFQPNVKGKD